MGKKSKRQRQLKASQNSALTHQANCVQVVAVFGAGAKIGVMCSHGNEAGKAEFIAPDVPEGRIEAVHSTMNFLAPREIKHGQSVQSSGLYLLTKLIVGERKQQLLAIHRMKTDPNQQLFELLPRIEPKLPEDWGSYPAAPEGRDDLVESILKIWEEQGAFILSIDGNPANCAMSNIKRVDLAVALRHHDDWKVNWEMNLTAEQVAFVHKHNQYFYLVAKA